MAESLAELHAAALAAISDARVHAEERDWGKAREAARELLSVGSKLHAKLSVIADLQGDADFVADAFRELTGRAKPAGPEPIPGDTPLPFPSSNGTPPRRGRGKGGPRKG